MAELKYVSVEKIFPNPERDIENYPFKENKIEELKQSMLSTDAWENIIARPCKGGYEQAYGHHRVEAFRQLAQEGKIKDRFPLIVRELDDNTMFKMMVLENEEDYNSYFDLTVVLPVEKAIDRIARGVADVSPIPPDTPKSNFRYVTECVPSGEDSKGKPYTAQQVAEVCGWVEKGGTPSSAVQKKILEAFKVIDLKTHKIIKPSVLRDLPREETKELVKEAASALKEKIEEIKVKEKDKEKREEAKAKAVAQIKGEVAQKLQKMREDKEYREKVREERKVKAVPAPREMEENDITKDVGKLLTVLIRANDILANSEIQCLDIIKELRNRRNPCDKEVIDHLNVVARELQQRAGRVIAGTRSALEYRKHNLDKNALARTAKKGN